MYTLLASPVLCWTNWKIWSSRKVSFPLSSGCFQYTRASHNKFIVLWPCSDWHNSKYCKYTNIYIFFLSYTNMKDVCWNTYLPCVCHQDWIRWHRKQIYHFRFFFFMWVFISQMGNKYLPQRWSGTISASLHSLQWDHSNGAAGEPGKFPRQPQNLHSPLTQAWQTLLTSHRLPAMSWKREEQDLSSFGLLLYRAQEECLRGPS